MKQGIKDFTQVLHNENEIVMYSILAVMDVLEEHKKILASCIEDTGGIHVKATHDKIIQIAAKNIVHMVKGEPFENIVDMKTNYRINHQI